MTDSAIPQYPCQSGAESWRPAVQASLRKTGTKYRFLPSPLPRINHLRHETGTKVPVLPRVNRSALSGAMPLGFRKCGILHKWWGSQFWLQPPLGGFFDVFRDSCQANAG
jgi:hypothetical protein